MTKEDGYTQQVELEVKILGINPRDISSKLELAGAHKILDAVTYIEAFDYEGDIVPLDLTKVSNRFHTILAEVHALTQGKQDLLSAGAYLRLREEGDRCELLLKHKIAEGTNQIKAEEETSLSIQKGEWENVRDTLLSVGLQKIIVQEKHRTSYIHSDIGARFDIDTWPKMPPYLEIEGSERAIKKGVALLGFSMDQATSISARDLFKLYGVDPRNLLFSPDKGRNRTGPNVT